MTLKGNWIFTINLVSIPLISYRRFTGVIDGPWLGRVLTNLARTQQINEQFQRIVKLEWFYLTN